MFVADEKYNEMYETCIRPLLYEFEKLRLAYKAKHDMHYKISTASFFVMLVCFIFYAKFIVTLPATEEGFNFLRFILFFIPFFILSAFWSFFLLKAGNAQRDFRLTVKNMFLSPFLSLFKEFKGDCAPSVSLDFVHKLGLYKQATKKIDDVVISGKYKNTHIVINETFLEHTYNVKDRTYKYFDFAGVIIEIECKKGLFNNDTKMGLQEYDIDLGVANVLKGDMPNLNEKINLIVEASKTHVLRCKFKDDTLYLFFNLLKRTMLAETNDKSFLCKNLFESLSLNESFFDEKTRLYKSFFDEATCRSVYETLKTIFYLIDYMESCKSI